MLDEYEDRMMVGETYVPLADLVKYYGENLDECHLPFNFRLIEPKDVDWRTAAGAGMRPSCAA